MRIYYLLGFCVLVMSCVNRKADPISYIEPEIQPYVDEFIAEAKARGYIVDFEDTGIRMEWGEVPARASAVCLGSGHAHDGIHHMIFSKKSWLNRTSASNASRVFHELGHCELSRPHNNTFLADKSWKTMMRGRPFATTEEETTPRAFYGFRKAYYIDELFDRDTPAPFWANMTYEYDEVPLEKKNVQLATESIGDTFLVHNLVFDEFEIEVEMLSAADGTTTKFEWGQANNGHYMRVSPSDKDVEIGIIEGGKSYLLHRRLHTEINFGEVHKWTIRMQGEFTIFFINDEFEFLLDPLQLPFQQIEIASNNKASIQSLKLFEIN